MKTLNGDEARYMVIYEDGEKVPDVFGDQGQATATREEAELLADEHREAGSAVTVLALDEEDGETQAKASGLRDWEREMVAQGYSQSEVSAAITSAKKAGFDPTVADDLHTLENLLDEEEGEEENGGPCGGCEGWGRNAVTGHPCQWCGGAGIGR